MRTFKDGIDEIIKHWIEIHSLFQPIENNEQHDDMLKIINELMDIAGDEKSLIDQLIDILTVRVQAYELSIYPELEGKTLKELCTTATAAKQNSNGQ